MAYHTRSFSPEYEDWVARLAEEARILGESRMIRDDQEVTAELAAQVIAGFNAFLTRAGKTQTWAARSLSMSPTTLSQVLSGTYGAEVEPHIRAIDKWTEQQVLREKAPKPAGFVKTSTAEKIYGVAKWILDCGGIGIIFGPAGVGKTITAQAIRAETPGAVFVSITTVGQSKLAVMMALARATRLPISATGDQLFQALVTQLRETGRLILVDEVHKLVGRQRDEALHSLRDLHDATGCPMLWFGMSEIAEYIRRGNTEGNDKLEQIFSRVSMWLDLSEIAARTDGGPGLTTIEDIQKLFAAQKVRLTPDAVRFLQMLANEPRFGGLRQVQRLVMFAMRVAKDRPIDAAMLRSIQASRLGQRAAQQVEQMMELRAAAVG